MRIAPKAVDLKRLNEILMARHKVIGAARLVAARCSSYRNAVCVMELKRAVEELQKLERSHEGAD